MRQWRGLLIKLGTMQSLDGAAISHIMRGKALVRSLYQKRLRYTDAMSMKRHYE